MINYLINKRFCLNDLFIAYINFSTITSYGGMGGVILLQIGGADTSSTNIHPCTFVDGEFLLSQKHRCCVEPPPSMVEATQ